MQTVNYNGVEVPIIGEVNSLTRDITFYAEKQSVRPPTKRAYNQKKKEDSGELGYSRVGYQQPLF